MLRFFGIAILLFIFNPARACECPLSRLAKNETKKYEIIFKGKVDSVRTCGDRPGSAVFKIEELYKGNAGTRFTVLFDCNSECAAKFTTGDEWIIYGNYKQIASMQMDWCSRSRKYFKNENEDYYAVNYGNDYYDEVKFLRDSLGLHRLLQSQETAAARNKLPNVTETILLAVGSLLAIILFYWLFNRFFKF